MISFDRRKAIKFGSSNSAHRLETFAPELKLLAGSDSCCHDQGPCSLPEVRGLPFHFITFSCYRRLLLLGSGGACRVFEVELDAARRRFALVVAGYVLMLQHIRLLVGEPRVSSLSIALPVLNQTNCLALLRCSRHCRTAKSALSEDRTAELRTRKEQP